MLLGYVEFVALLFVPGMAFMELFNLGRSLSFVESLALAWGLSMAIVAVTLFIRTSGFVLMGVKLVGFWSLSLLPILGASLAVFAGAIVVKRSSVFITRPTKSDLYLLLLVAVQSALLIAHFAKYPIFPASTSIDFQQTTGVSAALQIGRIASLPGGVFYYGVHTLIGSLLVLSGGIPLVASQQVLAIITALSPLLVYSSVLAIGGTDRSAFFASLVYVGTGFVWYGMVFDSGLYANFYGLLSAMLIIVLLHVVRGAPTRPQAWLAFGVGVANFYISHYSTLTILPAILAIPILQSVLNRKLDRIGLAAVLVLFVPGVAAFLYYPSLVSTILSFLAPSPVNNVLAATPLSSYLAAFPVLGYTVVEMTNDLLSVIVLALGAIGTAAIVLQRKGVLFLPVLWFASLLVIAPLNEAAWRFSFIGLLPLTMLSAVGMERLAPPAQAQRIRRPTRRRRRSINLRALRAAGVLILVVVMVASSETGILVVDSASGASDSNQAQNYVLQAMQWLGNNSGPGARVVSPTDENFIYTMIAVDRQGSYEPLLSPDAAVNFSKQSGYDYVALTQYVTVSGSILGLQHLLRLYSVDPRFRLVYQNPDVSIYRVLENSTP